MESTDGGAAKCWGGVAGLAGVGDHFFFFQLALKVILILKPEFFQILTYILNPQLPLTFQLTSLIITERRLSLRVSVCVRVLVWINVAGELAGVLNKVGALAILINLPITARLILIQTTAKILAAGFFSFLVASTLQSRASPRVESTWG